MADGINMTGIPSTMVGAGMPAAIPGGPGGAADAATQLTQPPVETPEAQAQRAANGSRAPEAQGAIRQSTAYTAAPTLPQTESKVVQRLLQQNASVYGPGLARIPLPARPDDVPRAVPKKPAGPMVAPRSLDGGRSPLAPESLQDARASVDSLGTVPTRDGEQGVVADAQDGAQRMPSRHGLVAYTSNERGDRVYLTQERWLHIRDNHMDPAPAPRGKRTTTYWPTEHAVQQPTMKDHEVIGVIVDAARKGTMRTEVRDTRMAEYDLPKEQAAAYGVSEAKVSMAPDGLVLSAYPGAGDNVLAVYEMNADDQAELARVQASAQQQNAAAGDGDDRMFRTNVASTTFG